MNFRTFATFDHFETLPKIAIFVSKLPKMNKSFSKGIGVPIFNPLLREGTLCESYRRYAYTNITPALLIHLEWDFDIFYIASP